MSLMILPLRRRRSSYSNGFCGRLNAAPLKINCETLSSRRFIFSGETKSAAVWVRYLSDVEPGIHVPSPVVEIHFSTLEIAAETLQGTRTKKVE